MTMTALWGVALVARGRVAGGRRLRRRPARRQPSSAGSCRSALLLAVTKATAGLWADYHERDVDRAQGASLVDGLLWDFGPSLDDEF